MPTGVVGGTIELDSVVLAGVVTVETCSVDWVGVVSDVVAPVVVSGVSVVSVTGVVSVVVALVVVSGV